MDTFISLPKSTNKDDRLDLSKLILAFLILIIPLSFHSNLLTLLGLRRHQTQWPSPPRVPFLGSLPYITTKDICQQFLKWRSKYGPTFVLKLGTAEEIIIVTGAEMAREIMILSGTSFTVQSKLFYTPELRLKDYFTVFMPTNSHVLSHRQLVVKSVKMALSNSKAGDCMDRASSYLIFQIHQHLSNHQNQEPVDLLLLLGQAISLMAVNIGFGFRWKTEDLNSKVEGRDILDSSERIFDLLQIIQEPTIIFPFLTRILPSRSNRLRSEAKRVTEKLLNSHQSLWNLAKSKVESHGEEVLEASVAKNLLTQNTNEELSEFQRFCMSGTTTAAATTTTTDSLHSAIGCLTALPDWQNKLQIEIDNYASQDFNEDQVKRLPGPGKEMISNLPLLRAFVDEVLRLYPPFKFISRTALRDVALSDGKIIKRGETALIVFHNINRDPALFKDPEKFDPTRFLLNENGNQSQVIWPKHGYTTFGGGRRGCPGAEMAKVEMICIMARLIYCFDLKFLNGETGLNQLQIIQPGAESRSKFPEVKFSHRRSDLDILLNQYT